MCYISHLLPFLFSPFVKVLNPFRLYIARQVMSGQLLLAKLYSPASAVLYTERGHCLRIRTAITSFHYISLTRSGWSKSSSPGGVLKDRRPGSRCCLTLLTELLPLAVVLCALLPHPSSSSSSALNCGVRGVSGEQMHALVSGIKYGCCG